MSWASYEDFLAEIPVIVPEGLLCMECEERAPESGTDHCQSCLDRLGERRWDQLYGVGSSVSERQRLQDEAVGAHR